MKLKIITLLLTAVVSLPSMAQNKVKTRANTNDERDAMTLVQKAIPGKNSKRSKKESKADIPAGYASVTLTAGDVWEDGSGYQMLLDADATAYGTVFPETGPLSQTGDVDASVYAEFEYKIPENADGAMSTSNIVINNSVTILIPAGTYDWCIANPTPEDRVWIASGNGNVGGRADDFVFVDGLEYVFTVSLGDDGSDQVDLVIGGVVLSYDVTNITDNSADAIWETEGIESVSVSIRYHKVNPNYVNDFEDDTDYEDLWVYDKDEDGYNWGYIKSSEYAHSGSIFLSSESYSQNAGALNPDNLLGLPEMDLSGKTLTFWARSFSGTWPDNFGVFFLPADATSLDDMVELMEPATAPEGWKEYTIELGDLGVGSIVFRHYLSEDKYRLFIDDVSIIDSNVEYNPADYDWVVVNEVTESPYTISGLESGTDYEMQMRVESMDWCESVFFTTLDGLVLEDNADNTTVLTENQGYSGKVKINGRTLYKDGNWNTICLPFDVTLEGSVLEGAIAKPISSATLTGKHVDITFGDAVSALETGVPYIIKWETAEGETAEDIVDLVFDNVTISSTEGQTISLADGNVKFTGYFNPMDITTDDTNIYYLSVDNKLARTSKGRTLNAFRAYFEFSANTSSYSVSFNFGTDAITSVQNTVADGETWFTLDGRQLSGKPAQKGVYVTNGQKVVVK